VGFLHVHCTTAWSSVGIIETLESVVAIKYARSRIAKLIALKAIFIFILDDYFLE
jgi:hypothetical protein